MTRPRLPFEPNQRAGGEQVDRAAHEAIRLAHLALDRFPDLVKRHSFIAGGAAVSSALVALAGVAVARRMRAGQSGAEAVASVTEQEIETPRSDRPARAAPTVDGPRTGSTEHSNGAEHDTFTEHGNGAEHPKGTAQAAERQSTPGA